MPSNFTENYSLSQWEKSDQVRMEDFNADNAKLDTALKAETDARATEDSSIRTDMNSALATKGNCQIWTTSYTGNGLYNDAHPKRVSFPGMPLTAFVVGSDGNLLVIPTISGSGMLLSGGGTVSVIFSWSGSTVSWYGGYPDSHMNRDKVRYTVIAFYAKS